MKTFYPIFFLIQSFATIQVMLSVDTIADVVYLLYTSFLLGWSLFVYLTMMHWLWYKNACQKMKTPKERKLVRFVMKKMLKLSPYYLAIHAFFFLLANCVLITHGVLKGVHPFAIVLLLPINCKFIIWFYWICYLWIRMAAFPLRNKLFRV